MEAASVQKSDNPRVTVITVVFNGAATLERALQSVACQDYGNHEHIVIDGGSKDGTVGVIKRYADGLAYWVSEPDGGIYDAMNKGIAAASGDIICTLNSDDYYPDPSCISDAVMHLLGSGADCVHARLHIVSKDDDSRVLRRYAVAVFKPWMLRFGIMPPHPTFFCRRAVYDAAGPYDTSYRIAGDFEILLRMLVKRGWKFSFLDRVLVVMRDGGVSNRGLRAKWILNREIVRACRENGVYTNLVLLAAKIPFKLFQHIARR